MGSNVMVQYFCRGSTRVDPGPFLFLIYVNNLSVNLSSNPGLFADDTDDAFFC